MRYLIACFSVTLLGLSSCAGAALQKDWKDRRGYSDDEIAEIREHASEYMKGMAWGLSNSNAFDSSGRYAAEQRMRNIFCSCVKKLGNRCTQKPTGLSGEDRILWAKANAAEATLKNSATTQNVFSSNQQGVDAAECQ